MATHRSDSAVQRDAEATIRSRAAEMLGKQLAPAAIPLASGKRIKIDGTDSDESVFVEIFAHQGEMKSGQRHKVAADTLKLITLGRSRPGAELVLVFADPVAAAYARAGSWLSEAVAVWRIRILVVDLGQSVCEGIREAQRRQKMINPSVAPGDDDG